MNQRLIAAVVAMPLVLGLGLYVGFAKLPYAYESTGSTINVLGQNESGARILQVVGHATYPDDGDLRMTYITVSRAGEPGHPQSGWLSGGEVLAAWFNPEQAVLPYEDVHPDGQTQQQSQQEGAAQMNTSQDDAIAVALHEMGITVSNELKVAAVTPDSPSVGKLQVDDVITSLNGKPLAGSGVQAESQSLVKTIQATPKGRSITVGITRDGKAMSVPITPTVIDGAQRIGITPGVGYDFPFDVSIHINPDIGGPSAGLMFSLAVYDYLTPGSLTGGHVIAGTGEILPNGSVGPIGGIAQKIATAREQGVQLYFVPKDNCSDALQADNAGSMRLVEATSMHEARLALQTWVADPNATLPTCQDTDEQAP